MLPEEEEKKKLLRITSEKGINEQLKAKFFNNKLEKHYLCQGNVGKVDKKKEFSEKKIGQFC